MNIVRQPGTEIAAPATGSGGFVALIFARRLFRRSDLPGHLRLDRRRRVRELMFGVGRRTDLVGGLLRNGDRRRLDARLYRAVDVDRDRLRVMAAAAAVERDQDRDRGDDQHYQQQQMSSAHGSPLVVPRRLNARNDRRGVG
jgi:hypothetical protein